MYYLIHYGELSLKGKNRYFFENKVIENLKKSARFNNIEVKVKKENKRLILQSQVDVDVCKKVIRNVFGIKYFALVKKIELNIDVLKKESLILFKELVGKGEVEIAFKTKRVNKKFNLNSPQINAVLGELANQVGLKVNYSQKKNILNLEVGHEEIFFYSEKILGLGGLPVGCSGRALVLLSGGIDSPVAAWNMMRRGCQVDFLHIHSFYNNDQVENSKIVDMVRKLNNYQFKSRICFIPYSTFSIMTLGKYNERYDLVVFKHYILKLADNLCKEYKYDAIITGDSLAQVASQTIENLQSVSYGIENLIFRPLLTFEKEDIIEKAKEIDTYSLSIAEYKDCCSIVSKRPLTKVKVEKFKYILKRIDLDKIILDSLERSKTINVLKN